MRKNIITLSILTLFTGIIFAQNNNYLLKDSILLDLDFLYEKLQEIHPDPFMNISQSDFVSKKESIYREIDDSLTADDFYFKVGALLSTLKDGHTSVTRPLFKSARNLNYGNKIFPLDIKIIEGKLHSVYDNFTKDSILGEIESINNIAMEGIIEKIIKSSQYDKYPDIRYNGIERNFFLFYNELCGADSIYNITYKNRSDKYVTHGLSLEKLQKKMRKYYSTIEHYKVHVNDEKNSAYIKFGNLIPHNKIYHFIDSAFALVNRKKVDTLVIDVRGNGGGSSKVIVEIMKNLTTDRFKIYDSVHIKISDYIKDSYQKKDSLFYQKISHLENGNIFKITSYFINPSNKKVYNGELIILTDKRTYSGASTFAHLIKTMERGEVLSETGGNRVYFGEYALYTLPHSKLKITVAIKKLVEWRSSKST